MASNGVKRTTHEDRKITSKARGADMLPRLDSGRVEAEENGRVPSKQKPRMANGKTQPQASIPPHGQAKGKAIKASKAIDTRFT